MSNQSVQMSDAELRKMWSLTYQNMGATDGWADIAMRFARAVESHLLAEQAEVMKEDSNKTAQLDFEIDDDSPRIVTWFEGGCRPAAETECAMWDLLQSQPMSAQAEVQQATVSQGGWINVDERVPELYEEVLVHPYPTDYCLTAQLWREGDWTYSEYDRDGQHHEKMRPPTHWMPLPAPPALQSPSTDTVSAEKYCKVCEMPQRTNCCDKCGSMTVSAEKLATEAHFERIASAVKKLRKDWNEVIAQQDDGKDASRNLPPLPEMALHSFTLGSLFSAKQMESYARLAAAIESTKRKGE